jgi:hypothetical protein
MSQATPGKVGWRPDEYAEAIGTGRTFVDALIRSGAIKSVKLGAARTAPRIITTPPAEYLASLVHDQDQAA